MEYEVFLTKEASPTTNRVGMSFNDQSLLSDTENVVLLRQRISTLELLLADKTSEQNDEVSKLHQQLSKLHSSFEKNELLRQKLEYELAVNQKEFHEDKRKNKETQFTLQLEINEFEAKIQSQSLELDEAYATISDQRKLQDEQNNDQMQIIEALKSNIQSLKNENEILCEGKNNQEKITYELQGEIHEYQTKCETLEEQRNDHVETIEKLVEDNNYLSKKEQDLLKQIQDIQNQKKKIEENVESERASYLEIKFNAEVLQLKLNDVESKLHDEVMVKSEIKKNLLETKKRYSELEERLKERDNVLKDAESATFMHIQQLEDNTAIVAQLTKELKTCEKEKRLMKDEIHKVQSEMEVSKHNHDDILETFTQFYSALKMNDGDDNKLDIKRMTEEMKSHVLNLNENISALTEKCIALEEEVEDIDGEKNKCLEEAEKLVTQAQANHASCQLQCAQHLEKIKEMKRNESETKQLLSETKHLLGEKSKEQQELASKFEHVLSDAEQIKQSCYSSLQVIYELLMTGNIQPSDRSIKLNSHQLKDAIVDQIQKDVYTSKQTAQKLSSQENQLKLLEKDIDKYRRDASKFKSLNSDILKKTEHSLMEGQNLYQREKEDLKEYYVKLVESKTAELQESKIYQNKLLDELKKLQNQIQDNMSSNNKCRKLLHKQEEDLRIFRLTFNILEYGLAGFIYTVYMLTMQKTILTNLLKTILCLKNNIIDLTRTLSTGKTSQSLRGILRFRVIAILVLANNRLKSFVKLKTLKCTGRSTSKEILYASLRLGSLNTDCNFLSLICDTNKYEKLKKLMKPLYLQTKELSKVDRNREYESNEIYVKIVENYHEYLTTINCWHGYDENNNNISLAVLLGRGLSRILCTYKHIPTQYYTVEHTTSFMNKSILTFTSRLHESEVDRKTLRNNCERYKLERNKIKEEWHMSEKNYKNKLRSLEHEVESRGQNKDELNGVCNDLNDALTREDELQMLFEQQTQQIQNMNQRIESYEQSLQTKDVELTDTLKALLDSRDHIKRQEISISNLKQANINDYTEKEKLLKVMNDRDTQLGQINKEREVISRLFYDITTYLKQPATGLTPDGILRQMNAILPEFDEAINNVGTSPEIELCRNAMKVLVDSQQKTLQQVWNLKAEKQSMRSKMVVLEDDINAHRSHVHRLKHQITQVCQQDVQQTKFTSPTHDDHNFIPLSIIQK